MSNIFWHNNLISSQKREHLNHHKGACLWFTGLSGSGKSTLAVQLEAKLYEMGKHTYILDGDNIRHGLNKDLGFTDSDREENIRRVGEVAKLFVDAGLIVITAFISPFIKDRNIVRNLFDNNQFIEVYIKCTLEICEERDVKGLYKKARLNELNNFTGVSSKYEPPINPELILVNETIEDIDKNISNIIQYLTIKNIIY